MKDKAKLENKMEQGLSNKEAERKRFEENRKRKSDKETRGTSAFGNEKTEAK